MYLAEGLQQKWAPVLDHEDMPQIKDRYRRAVTAVLLENQEKAMKEEGGQQMLSEAIPTNNISAGAQVQFADPVLISMIRYPLIWYRFPYFHANSFDLIWISMIFICGETDDPDYCISF